MNTSQLKSYAPAARRAFIAAVSAQAAALGITEKETAPATVQGDVLLIAGAAFPKAVAEPRTRLAERVRDQGFHATMDAIAYTWFNRFAAIRYMELHGYLDHGYRVLSHPEGLGRPQILDHAADVDLPGLDRAKAVELKLDGTQDQELYRLLLLAQCNALHQAMPFLFEPIGGADELLLPANLLHTDSLVRQMVEEIDENVWQDIEIIGWLYQFYISEKKDQVIGKVVKSEDIPAATQLFTPNWIVKYMVQNSLGAQWLATYPHSPLKDSMAYYIEPAEQTDEVNAQLAAITPKSLNPEELTLIDPACGSGHILVEAYELFKAIYLERGYRQRDVARLILEKNLYGLDIDGRAAQLTGFALMMKGRADDRRLFGRGVRLNVMALVDSAGFDAERLADGVKLAKDGVTLGDLKELKGLFEHATTFGSLIQVPAGVSRKLPALRRLGEVSSPDLFVSEALKRLGPLVRQAEVLAARYDAVVANPPYMGGKYMAPAVSGFVKRHYSEVRHDLFSASVVAYRGLVSVSGAAGFVTPFTWMFLKAFRQFRTSLLRDGTLSSLVKPEYHAFFESAYVPLCAFVIRASHTPEYLAEFFDLSRFYGADLQPKMLLEAIGTRACDWRYSRSPDDFKSVPGSPIAYTMSPPVLDSFRTLESLHDHAEHVHGMSTGNNDRYMRQWSEVSCERFNTECSTHAEAVEAPQKWFPFNKGGPFRRWYGNNYFAVNYQHGGAEMRAAFASGETPGFRCDGSSRFFSRGITWSSISSSAASFRHLDPGFVICNKGQALYPRDTLGIQGALGLLNSIVAGHILAILSPTLGYELGYVKLLPAQTSVSLRSDAVPALVSAARADWDSYERSWDFQSLPLLTARPDPVPTLESSYTAWTTQNRATITEMKRLEEVNNRLFIDAYGLQDELTPDVLIEQITLTVNPAYRYGGKLTEAEQWTRFRQDTMEELSSYAIGCMMGRYSLDTPGLIYAHSGNEGFDPSRYATFPADDDGIVPLSDTAWFPDDAATRLIEFIRVAWPAEHLEDNLTFLADNLKPKKNETSRETIRRWLNDKFFKDHHLKRYKKRPIYWLFSSGRQKAFQALVYLHRYNEGTLSRMRAEYVIPLQGKLAARIEKLPGDVQDATSTAHRKGLEKELTKLQEQQVELLTFDEKLRHYADKRITLDLDDGVKVNYGKFGDLLAEVKAVHGKKPEGA